MQCYCTGTRTCHWNGSRTHLGGAGTAGPPACSSGTAPNYDDCSHIACQPCPLTSPRLSNVRPVYETPVELGIPCHNNGRDTYTLEIVRVGSSSPMLPGPLLSLLPLLLRLHVQSDGERRQLLFQPVLLLLREMGGGGGGGGMERREGGDRGTGGMEEEEEGGGRGMEITEGRDGGRGGMEQGEEDGVAEQEESEE